MDIQAGTDAARRPIVHSEYLEQKAYFEWLALTYPSVFALTFHIPNGGKRSKAEASRLKKMGVKAGVPDIFMAIANKEYHGLFIELKTPKREGRGAGRLSESQTQWIDSLNAEGYYATVCYGWADAADLTREYLRG